MREEGRSSHRDVHIIIITIKGEDKEMKSCLVILVERRIMKGLALHCVCVCAHVQVCISEHSAMITCPLCTSAGNPHVHKDDYL